MFILILSIFMDVVLCVCVRVCVCGLFWQISLQSRWAKKTKKKNQAKSCAIFCLLYRICFVLQRDNKAQMGARCLFSKWTPQPKKKSHHRDESGDHKRCISNPSDVTSLEITCKLPDSLIWWHVNIWSPPVDETLCKFMLYVPKIL